MANLRVETSTSDEVTVVAIAGDLDLAGAGVLDRALEQAWSGDAGALVLDLRDVEFMDSSGLRVIIVASQRAEKDARRFALVPGKAQVMRVFEITRMEERLHFVEDPAELGRAR
ncbi:MAG TPA: STAS domain-containing protein [Solirubrobacteraceae bacterium]|nr:STAS domain-containing protein [Solirubrobacteraceae bacterium]